LVLRSFQPIKIIGIQGRNRIASRAPDFFKIPHDAIIEVGFRVEI
jgi:KUP system potassium uptake protein